VASRFAHCDWLRFDSALHAMLCIARFPATDAILWFFGPSLRGVQAEKAIILCSLALAEAPGAS
jgi:hypothetical protein